MIEAIYIFLTVLMVLDCVLLVFLVLLQLPKKEAGAGIAFGGAATDALFGAGSGNVLTKITKYVAGVFFALAIVMALLAGNLNKSSAGALLQQMTQKGPAPATPLAVPPPTAPITAPPSTGLLQLTNAATPAPVAPAASAKQTNH